MCLLNVREETKDKILSHVEYTEKGEAILFKVFYQISDDSLTGPYQPYPFSPGMNKTAIGPGFHCFLRRRDAEAYCWLTCAAGGALVLPVFAPREAIAKADAGVAIGDTTYTKLYAIIVKEIWIDESAYRTACSSSSVYRSRDRYKRDEQSWIEHRDSTDLLAEPSSTAGWLQDDLPLPSWRALPLGTLLRQQIKK